MVDMAFNRRRVRAKTPRTWLEGLIFNGLLASFVILALWNVDITYTSDLAIDPNNPKAQTTTRENIAIAFREIADSGEDGRAVWADRVETTVLASDFSAARGYLLAAPYMLDKSDAAALQSAVDEEYSGDQDERLARAALIFLPDTARASYQIAIAPPDYDRPPPQTTTASSATAPSDAPEANIDPGPVPDPLKTNLSMMLLGDAEDLTRRSQRWLIDDQRDSFPLRLRALGLIKSKAGSNDEASFVEAASILTAGHRASRLSRKFTELMTDKVEATLPEAALQARLNVAFEPVMTTADRSREVIRAYEDTIDHAGLDDLSAEMETIARLADLASSAGALTLIEQIETPNHMQRILLLAEAGGERSVALAREIGPDILTLAQPGILYTRGLLIRTAILILIAIALIITSLSFLTNRNYNPEKRPELYCFRPD